MHAVLIQGITNPLLEGHGLLRLIENNIYTNEEHNAFFICVDVHYFYG